VIYAHIAKDNAIEVKKPEPFMPSIEPWIDFMVLEKYFIRPMLPKRSE